MLTRATGMETDTAAFQTVVEGGVSQRTTEPNSCGCSKCDDADTSTTFEVFRLSFD